MRLCKRLCLLGILLCALCALLTVCINVHMVRSTKGLIYSKLDYVPQKYTAIVLGSKVSANGTVSHVFRDRIAGGIDLLQAGTVQKVLVSGDHGRAAYDEVNSARAYIELMYHVDESLIFLDHAGFSTYDTMYRARDVFCVKDAVVVTQPFHLARSLYIAHRLGIDAVGYAAPEITPFARRTKLRWTLRECLARVKAFFYVALNARPAYLGEPLPITGDGHITWD